MTHLSPRRDSRPRLSSRAKLGEGKGMTSVVPQLNRLTTASAAEDELRTPTALGCPALREEFNAQFYLPATRVRGEADRLPHPATPPPLAGFPAD